MSYDEELQSLIASCTDSDIERVKVYLSKIQDIDKFFDGLLIFNDSIGKSISIFETSVCYGNYKLLEYILSIASTEIQKKFFESFTLNEEYNNSTVLRRYAIQLKKSMTDSQRKKDLFYEIIGVLKHGRDLKIENSKRPQGNKDSNKNTPISHANVSQKLSPEEQQIINFIKTKQDDKLEKCFYDNPRLIYTLSNNEKQKMTLLQVAHSVKNKFAIQLIMKIFSTDNTKNKKDKDAEIQIEQKKTIFQTKFQTKNIDKEKM